MAKMVKVEDLVGGERVSLTIEGTVENKSSGDLFVRVAHNNGYWLLDRSQEIELLPKPLPTALGSVVRYPGHGGIYFLTKDGWVSQYSRNHSDAPLPSDWELVYEA